MPDQTVRFGLAEFSVEVLDCPAKGEDAYLVRDDFVGVADGATPLTLSSVSPAALARRSLVEVAARPDLEVHAAVQAMIETASMDTQGTDSPSASAVWARTNGDDLEVATMSDCLAVVRLRDGRVLASATDEVHAAIDRASLAPIGVAIRGGMSFADARSAATPALLAGRARMNTEGGYWVVANDPRAADAIDVFRTPISEVEAILVCSDGFTRVWDMLHLVAAAAGLLDWAEQIGVNRLGEVLREVEKAPGGLGLAPRFSLHDDTTAVLLRRLP